MSDLAKIWLLSRFINNDAERREIEKEKRHLLYLKQLQDEERGVHHVTYTMRLFTVVDIIFIFVDLLAAGFIHKLFESNQWECVELGIIFVLGCLGVIWYWINESIYRENENKNEDYTNSSVLVTIILIGTSLAALQSIQK